MTTALIDFDIFCYRCAAATQADPIDYTKDVFDGKIKETLTRLKADDYLGVFTPRGYGNLFRYDWHPGYKAGRGDPPANYAALREYAYANHPTECGIYCEADDLLRMRTTSDTISVSIDKDDLTYPGKKYHFVKDEIFTVDEYTAAYNFYYQMLLGDSVDKIQGAAGIGKAKAPRLLEGCSIAEMHQVVQDVYDSKQRFVTNYNLLRMWANQWEVYTGDEILQLNSYEEFMKTLNEVKAELLLDEDHWDEAE